MSKPLILVVDDAPDLLALIVRALSDEYEVRTATSGAQALLAAAAEPRPVLILLDVEMEGSTGFDACKALKSNPATAAIPVIFITGKGEKKNEMLGFTLGAVDYVAKPINSEILKLRVATHVALASRRAALEGMVRERTAKLEAAHLEVIRCLGRAMESHESAAAGKCYQRIALTHHERWDGSGYPKGLKGEAIPWPGRLVAIVDAFEAMTTTQFYREPLSIEQASQEILRHAAAHYDPKLTEAFKKALPAMRKVRGAIADDLGEIINLDFSAAAHAAKAPAPKKPLAAVPKK